MEPRDRWEPGWVDVIHGDGPMRIYDDNPRPEWRTHVGFIKSLEAVEVEPLTWDGDNA